MSKLKEKFTITGLIFEMTGNYVIKATASDSYKKKCSDEIKNGLIYKYIISDINEELVNNMTLEYDDGTLNADPIIQKFLCSENKELADIYYILSSSNLSDKNIVINRNSMIEIPKITEEDYLKYAKIAIENKNARDIRRPKIKEKVYKKGCMKDRNMI